MPLEITPSCPHDVSDQDVAAQADGLCPLCLAAEISKSWQTLEGHGFPPEACGWPFRSIVGELPNGIHCAIDCLVRQRETLLAEVLELRKRPDPSIIAASAGSGWLLGNGKAAQGKLP